MTGCPEQEVSGEVELASSLKTSCKCASEEEIFSFYLLLVPGPGWNYAAQQVTLEMTEGRMMRRHKWPNYRLTYFWSYVDAKVRNE